MSNHQCFNIRDKGACEFGSDCRFLHPGADTRASRQKAGQICYTLRDEGACKYGADCRFSHDLKLVEAKPKAAPAKAAAGTGEHKAAAGEKRERAPRRRRRGGAVAGGDKPAHKAAVKTESKSEAKATSGASNGATVTATTEKKTFTAPAGAGRLSCYQFKQNGSCEFGERCRFIHEGASAQTRGSRLKNTEVCYALRDDGACKFGADCRYSHDLKSAGDSVAKRERAPRAARPARTARPAPTERSDKVCYRWEKDGECKFGDDCRFVHPAE